MKLVKAEVLTHTQATDKVYIETDLTEAVFPFEEKLCLKFDAKAGTGIEYVKANFPGLRLKECNIHTGIITVHVTGEPDPAEQKRLADVAAFKEPMGTSDPEDGVESAEDRKKIRAEAHQRYMDYMDDASMVQDLGDNS